MDIWISPFHFEVDPDPARDPKDDLDKALKPGLQIRIRTFLQDPDPSLAI